jgi:hypothetical protein
MSLAVPEAKQYEKPNPGFYLAEITDVKDLGVVKSPLYGDKPRGELTVRLLDAYDSEGKLFELRHRFNIAGGPKASMTKMLQGILDYVPPPKWELVQLVGMRCNVVVTHSTPNAEGKVWANITSFLPANDKSAKLSTAIRKRQESERQHVADEDDVEFPGDATGEVQ